MRTKEKNSIFLAILAAALYSLSSPLSKLLLGRVSSVTMAGLLYLGAGIGLVILRLIQRLAGLAIPEKRLSVKDAPWTLAMVLLDTAAPICLMSGLRTTTAANASLLNNFEIVATSLIAMFIFKEKISKRLWAAISLVTLASIILTVEDVCSFQFSSGSLLVLLASVCWGFENNCTRRISNKDPLQIVVIKGFGSGIISLLIASAAGEQLPALKYILFALLLGFVAYGLSILFYIYAQRSLGAAKTSTYYAVAPFIGTALSLAIFREAPPLSFWIALLIMASGARLASTE
ncbi:MAG: DMT family transporter [Candidatus Limivicinus sp.]|jgi:drug/metabolite transporter (DMT)-like permease